MATNGSDTDPDSDPDQLPMQISRWRSSRELRIGQITSVSFRGCGVVAEPSSVKGMRRMNTGPLTLAVSPTCAGCMNDTEVTMHDSQANNDLIAYTVALEAATATVTLAGKVPAPFKSLADQLIRAASSVPANLTEGYGRTGRARLNHWRIAYASAKEVDAFLHMLMATGCIEGAAAEQAIELFDRVRALTWRLLHPKKGA